MKISNIDIKNYHWSYGLSKIQKYSKEYGLLYYMFFLDKWDIFHNIPILNVDHSRGRTDYIDYIKHNDMTHPIMKGIDIYNRPFIAIRYHCLDNSTIKTFSKNSPTDDISQTSLCIFQRYSDCPELLVIGSHYFHTINSIGGLKQNSIDWLQRIIKGEKVENPTNITNSNNTENMYADENDTIKNWVLV